jgi:hypothetical protein
VLVISVLHSGMEKSIFAGGPLGASLLLFIKAIIDSAVLMEAKNNKLTNIN